MGLKKHCLINVLIATVPLMLLPRVCSASPCTDCLESIQQVCLYQCQLIEGQGRQACEKTCATKACSGFCSNIGAFEQDDGSARDKKKAQCLQCFGGKDVACERRCSGLKGERAESCIKKCMVKKCGDDCESSFPAFHRVAPSIKSEECLRCESKQQRTCDRMCGRQTGLDAVACVPACLKEQCQSDCSSPETKPAAGERTF